jgi:hypothetical protein
MMGYPMMTGFERFSTEDLRRMAAVVRDRERYYPDRFAYEQMRGYRGYYPRYLNEI